VRSQILIPAALFASLALVFACKGSSSGVRYLSIATGGTGGVYYPYGGGIAKILNEHLPNVRASAEVTAASVDNIKLIRDGRADLAFTFADTLDDAVHGRGAFEASGPVKAASLAVLYSNCIHVVVAGSSSIHAIADLRGTVISTGSAGSGTEVIALRMLRAAGLDPDRDVTRQALGVTESAAALKDGKLDGFFWGGGLPTPAIQDLAHTRGITIRLLPAGDLVRALREQFGDVYYQLDVPPGTYPGVENAVPSVGSSNVLIANLSMPEELAYDIVRTMFEHQSELGSIHPEARKLSLERAAAGSPAEFHPGAIKFYREKGVWKP
jgi:TRAP transporter TAXI family solute receptor